MKVEIKITWDDGRVIIHDVGSALSRTSHALFPEHMIKAEDGREFWGYVFDPIVEEPKS